MDYKTMYETMMITIKAFYDTKILLEEKQKEEFKNKKSCAYLNSAESQLNKNRIDFENTMIGYLKDYEELKNIK